MIPSPPAKMAARARFKNWLNTRLGSPESRAGMLDASAIFAEGASGSDPWGSIVKGLSAYGRGMASERTRLEEKSIEDQERARRQAQEDARAAQQAEQFELTKKVTEVQLAEAEAKRALAEERRTALGKWLETAAPEDQALLGPYADDPDLFARVYDSLADNRRDQAQFEADLAEKQRRNKVNEGIARGRLDLEKKRVTISEQGSQQKAGKVQIRKVGPYIVTQDAQGKEIGRELIPESPADRRKAAIRIMDSTGASPEEVAKIMSQLDTGLSSMMPSHPPAAKGGDEELLSAIQDARAAGQSDVEILALIADPAKKARVAALLRGR